MGEKMKSSAEVVKVPEKNGNALKEKATQVAEKAAEAQDQAHQLGDWAIVPINGKPTTFYVGTIEAVETAKNTAQYTPPEFQNPAASLPMLMQRTNAIKLQENNNFQEISMQNPSYSLTNESMMYPTKYLKQLIDSGIKKERIQLLATAFEDAYKDPAECRAEGGLSGKQNFCSASVKKWFHKNGIKNNATNTAKSWLTQGTHVERENMKPGDVVVFDQTGPNTEPWQGHVGLFLGYYNGQAMMVDANMGQDKGADIHPFSIADLAFIGARRFQE